MRRGNKSEPSAILVRKGQCVPVGTHCGAPLSPGWSQGIYLIVSALALVLVACGKQVSPVPAPTPRPSPVVISVPHTAVQTSGQPKNAAEIMQEARWEQAKLRASDLIALDKAVELYRRTEARYAAIEKMRANGVPAPIIFALHGRESTWNFNRHLHEGSPLTGRTKFVPKGRPLSPEPPYTFEQSAEDALYKLKDLENKVRWGELGNTLQAIERYNGLGYQKYHAEVPSPYLWSATTLYTAGKYVADGKFDPSAVDRQLGCAAVLMRMRDRGVRNGL